MKANVNYNLSNKHSFIQIINDSDNTNFRKTLIENDIIFTTSCGKGIHFDKKDYKKVKQLTKNI